MWTISDQSSVQSSKKPPAIPYVGLGDGAKDNWTFLKQYTNVQILDFFHASEYVSGVATVLFNGNGKNSERKTWLQDRLHVLKPATVAPVAVRRPVNQYEKVVSDEESDVVPLRPPTSDTVRSESSRIVVDFVVDPAFVFRDVAGVLSESYAHHPVAAGWDFLFGKMWSLGGLTFGFMNRFGKGIDDTVSASYRIHDEKRG